MRKPNAAAVLHNPHEMLLAQQRTAALLQRSQREASDLLLEIYDQLQTWGNCVFCMADLKKVTPGARSGQKRRHGHPKNCLRLKLDAFVRKVGR